MIWEKVSDEKSRIINKTINKLGISEGDSFLDVASGTGVLYAVLKQAIAICCEIIT